MTNHWPRAPRADAKETRIPIDNQVAQLVSFIQPERLTLFTHAINQAPLVGAAHHNARDERVKRGEREPGQLAGAGDGARCCYSRRPCLLLHWRHSIHGAGAAPHFLALAHAGGRRRTKGAVFKNAQKRRAPSH